MIIMRPRKAWHKIGLFALVAILAFGLVGSSVIGLLNAGSREAAEPDPVSRQEQVADALVELEQQVAANPEDVTGRLQLAAYYKGMMDFQRAEELFEEVLQIDPENQRARVDLAEMYFILERHDEAVLHLDSLLELNPEHQLGVYLYGIVLGLGKGQYAEASEKLNDYLSLNDSGPEAEHARLLLEEWAE